MDSIYQYKKNVLLKLQKAKSDINKQILSLSTVTSNVYNNNDIEREALRVLFTYLINNKVDDEDANQVIVIISQVQALHITDMTAFYYQISTLINSTFGDKANHIMNAILSYQNLINNSSLGSNTINESYNNSNNVSDIIQETIISQNVFENNNQNIEYQQTNYQQYSHQDANIHQYNINQEIIAPQGSQDMMVLQGQMGQNITTHYDAVESNNSIGHSSSSIQQSVENNDIQPITAISETSTNHVKGSKRGKKDNGKPLTFMYQGTVHTIAPIENEASVTEGPNRQVKGKGGRSGVGGTDQQPKKDGRFKENKIHDPEGLLRSRRLSNDERQRLLAQTQKAPPPFFPRIRTHWDYLVEEAQWMAIDYKQELKWKVAQSSIVARQCVDYIKQRSTILQIKCYEIMTGSCISDNKSIDESAILSCKAIALKISQKIKEKWSAIESIGKKEAQNYISKWHSALEALVSAEYSGEAFVEKSQDNLLSMSSTSKGIKFESAVLDSLVANMLTTFSVDDLGHELDLNMLTDKNSKLSLSPKQLNVCHRIMETNKRGFGTVVAGDNFVGKTSIGSNMLRIWLSKSEGKDALLLCSKNNLLHWMSELDISCPNTCYEVWADNDSWKSPFENVVGGKNKVIICAIEEIHTILELEIIAVKQQSIGIEAVPTKSYKILTQCCGVLVDIRDVDHEKVKFAIEEIKISTEDFQEEHWLSSFAAGLCGDLKNRCIISRSNIDVKEYSGIFSFILPSITVSWSNWIESSNINLTSKKPVDILEKFLIPHHDLDNLRYHSINETIYKIELTPPQKYKYFSVLNYLIEHKQFTKERANLAGHAIALLQRICLHAGLISISGNHDVDGSNDNDYIKRLPLSSTNSPLKYGSSYLSSRLYSNKVEMINADRIIYESSKMDTLYGILNDNSSAKTIILVNSNHEIHAVRKFLKLFNCKFVHTGIENSTTDDSLTRISTQKKVFSFNQVENDINILITTSSLIISNEIIPIFVDIVIVLSDNWMQPFDHNKLLRTCLNRNNDDSLKIMTIVNQNTLEDAVNQYGSFQNLQGLNIFDFHGPNSPSITLFDGDAKIMFKGKSTNEGEDWVKKLYQAYVLADSIFYNLALNNIVTLKPHKNKAQRNSFLQSPSLLMTTTTVPPVVDSGVDAPIDLTNDFLSVATGNDSNSDLASLVKPEPLLVPTSTHSNTPGSSPRVGSGANSAINAENDDKDLIDTIAIEESSNDFSYGLEFAIPDMFHKFMQSKVSGGIHSAKSDAALDLLLSMAYFQANDWRKSLLEGLEEKIVGGTVALNQSRLSDNELLRLRLAGIGVSENEKLFWSINRPISTSETGHGLRIDDKFQQLIVDCNSCNVLVERHLLVHPLQTCLFNDYVNWPSWLRKSGSVGLDIITKYMSKSAQSKAQQRRQRSHSARSDAQRKRILEQLPTEHKKIKLESSEKPNISNWKKYAVSGPLLKLTATPKVRETDMTLEPWTQSEDNIIISLREVYPDTSFILCESALNNPPVRLGLRRSAKEASERYEYLRSHKKINTEDPTLKKMITSIKASRQKNNDSEVSSDYYRSSSIISTLSSSNLYEGFFKTIQNHSANI